MQMKKRDIKAAEKAQSAPVIKTAKNAKLTALPKVTKAAKEVPVVKRKEGVKVTKLSQKQTAKSPLPKSSSARKVLAVAKPAADLKVAKRQKEAKAIPAAEVKSPKSLGITQPKMFKSAYLFFSMEMGPKLMIQLKAPMAEVARQTGILWKGMDEKQRLPYTEKSNLDKKRHTDELEMLKTKGYFILPDGRKSSDYRTPLKTDLHPKKALTAYMAFVGQNMSKVMTENKLQCTEASKKLGVMWNAMTDAEKKPYDDAVASDKVRHDTQIAEFKLKGYFTLADGKKSFEVKAKVKRSSKTDEKKEQLGKRTQTARKQDDPLKKGSEATKRAATPKTMQHEQAKLQASIKSAKAVRSNSPKKQVLKKKA